MADDLDLGPAVLRTELPFPVRRGKVRDVYDLGGHLLIVATDRLSAFDVVLDDGIPGKGKVLTALSRFWFDRFGDRFEHHLVSAEVADYPAEVAAHADVLRGRSMLVRKAAVVPFECVARGYLAGSGWAEYRRTGTVCGVPLPRGLRKNERLPEPIFTPATKADAGHDQNVPFDRVAEALGATAAADLRERTLALYAAAAAVALDRGVVLADTKFEFGVVGSDEGGPRRTVLVDEVLTPDSSRFWPAESYAVGGDVPSFDKQFVRDWLEAQPWDKRPPAPRLPADVVAGTRRRYLEAFEKLTGRPFAA